MTTALQSLEGFPVVGLIGSRQTGKTTLAKALASTARAGAVYLDLERPSDLARLTDPELYLSQQHQNLVILDEIQRRPDLFPILRALVDADRRNGRFLILGSASPALLKQSSESLAGRVVYQELSPLLLAETGTANDMLRQLWVRGGYPQSLLAGNDQHSLAWREAFISTYLERDMPQLGIRVAASQLRHFWQMLAHLHGQLWNGSKVAASLGVSAPTASRYLTILEDTFLVRHLHPYHSNLKKRLVKSPKIYLRDSGLLHALLRVGDYDQLLGHPSAGASWEGWVIEQILGLLPPQWDYCFYATAAGAEIDLILLPPRRAPVAVEVKLSLSPSLSRGFRQGFEDLGCQRGYVMYPGAEQFPLSQHVTALPVSQAAVVFQA